MAKSSSRKNAKRSRSPRKEVQERSITSFENIRSVIFSKHQISFMDSVDDFYRNNNPIATTPTIAFADPSSSNSTVLIDYSHSANYEDLQIIRSLFKNTNRGTQFTISDASWQSPLDMNYETADLSGTYEFVSFENDLIVATAVSVSSSSSVHMTYDPKHFIEVPQLTKNISNTDHKISAIQNLLGEKSNNSFHSLLGLSESFVNKNQLWITVGGSAKNTGKLKLLNYKIDEEGKEILFIENDIKKEDFLSSTDGILQINLYKKEGDELKRDKVITSRSEHEHRTTQRTNTPDSSFGGNVDHSHGESRMSGSENISTDPLQPTGRISSDSITGTFQSWEGVQASYRSNINQFSNRIPSTSRTKRQIEKTFNISVIRSQGKNQYAVNGKRQERLLLEKGKTYNFVQKDSSNEGHPLRISKVRDGTHNQNGTGTIVFSGIYTRGSLGSTAITTVNTGVIHDELHVFCENHPGMGFTLQIKDPKNLSVQPSRVSRTTQTNSTPTSTEMPTTTPTPRTTTRSSSTTTRSSMSTPRSSGSRSSGY